MTTTVANPTHPAVATSALRAAREMRGEALFTIADGLIDPIDVARDAMTPEGEPLRRISLRQLLLAQPGWGEARTDELIRRLHAFCEITEPPRRLSIRWLIDPRVSGRRLVAFCDLLDEGRAAVARGGEVDVVPWAGYPFTPMPTEGTVRP
ncbi:hypothetical protein OMK64_01750 [Cellulomonas fimi]|uniref:hypothetical protein n=1 Tax=Cellulomonas fimi TaxID=1708 RepID=UPI00234C10BF|nr:hypothetical protein [Cellulomonas fimi]MDC7120256.1 hypothetical protein [Cellulomonas fimi]